VIRSVAPDGRPDLGGAFQPIDRPRVVDRIATAAQYRIATIIAPAGFGKSVALRQFLSTVRSFVVYDVPSDATALIPFVRGFADALSDVVPALRRSLSTAIEGARNSEMPGRDLAAWAATHVRALDTLLVIDDLHVGEDDPEISKFIVALVERVKTGPRWLFSSRSPLQLPIASWLAYGESDLVIDAVDLRFDLAEAKRSARSTRIAVREDELTAILELTDGWPAALAFALRTSTRASDLRTVSAGTREMVYRYLAEQVWHSLDDRIRGFLRTAAFLPRLETRLAVAAGYDDAASIIETLRERVAFVSVLESNVYKLHDLFRDFVQRQVAMEGDGALRAAQIAAGRVLEVVGMPGTALERYIEAQAANEIEELIASENFALLDGGHIDTVERALRLLPGSRLAAQPAILAVRAAVEEAHGRVDQAEKWFVAAIDRAVDFDLQVTVTARFGIFMQQRGRLDAVDALEAIRRREDTDSTQRAHVLGILAGTYAVAGQLEQAQVAIDEALAIAEFGDDELRARTYGRAAVVAFYAVDEEALERFVREGIRLATEIGAYGVAARLASALHSMHLIAGRLPAAAWYAAQVAAHGEKAGDPYARALGLRTLFQVEAERGNTDRIAEIERELAAISYRGPVALFGQTFGQIMVLLWHQQFAEAKALISRTGLSHLSAHQRRSYAALLAIASAACGDTSGAGNALAEYDRAVEADRDNDPRGTFDRARALAERLAILGTLLAGKNAVAHRMLRNLRYPRTELEPFDAALSALHHHSGDALEAALRDTRRVGYGGFAMLVEAVASLVPGAAREPAEGELTAMELQILRCMARGLSNQAIADDQRRTVNTVRTHVSAVLRKLGAASRGEAVALGRRRALV
jgi:ATP/maltotriose-dependent transcriptional regulator MalT